MTRAMPMRGRPLPPALHCALLAAIALVAGGLAFFTMRTGIGLTNDSQAYLRLADGMMLRAARVRLIDTDILSRRFPPAFPALLAAIDSLLRFGPQRVARLMNVACLMLSTGLVGAIVWTARREPWRAVLAAALFAASSDAFNTHVNLFSEPTFTLWMLLGTLSIAMYLRAGQRLWLIATALLGSVAVLTRYAAVALVIAEAIVVLFRSPRERRIHRVIDAAIVAIVPAVAMFAWTLGAPQSGTGIGQRDVTFALVTTTRLDQLWATLGSFVGWYAPWPAVARTGGVIAVATLVSLIARSRRALTNPTLALPWTYLCVYPLFLAISITFVDPATPLDLRILSPLHVMAILVGCATLGSASWRTAIVAGALVVAQLASTGYYLSNVRQTGMGYASARWRENETVRAAGTLPWQLPIFTTHHFALEFLTGRDVFELPMRQLDAPDTPLDTLVQPTIDLLRAAGGRGYLVYLKRPKPNKPFLTPADLGHYLNLQRIANAADGQIFKVLAITNDPTPVATTSRATVAIPRASPNETDAADPN